MNHADHSPRPDTEDQAPLQQALERIQSACGQMQYGQVVIHVRGGIITHIECLERTRMTIANAMTGPGR